MLLHLLILFAACALNSVHSQDLPSYIKVCPKRAADHAECTKQAVELVWKQITTVGLPELKKPPMDPLVVEKVNGTVTLGFVDGIFHFTNLKVLKISKAQVLSATLTRKDKQFRLDIQFYCQEMIIDTDYLGNGDFGLFSVDAKGHMNVQMTDVNLEVALDGQNLNDRLVAEKVSIHPVMKGLVITATDELSDNGWWFRTAMSIMNSWWETLYPPLAPLLTDPMNDVVKDYVNGAYAKVPLSKAFPEA